MKIICSQIDLSKNLSIVSKAIGGSQLTVLENILITANSLDREITCIATNLEIAIKAKTPAEVFTDSDPVQKVLLPGKQLASVVRSLPSGMVEIVTSESGATVKCGKSNFKLPVAPIEEFPDIKEPEGDGFTISAELLQRATKQTIFATIPKDTRPFICSVLFDISNKTLTMVGTDVNRLAIRKMTIEGNPLNEQLMIPVNSLKKLIDAVPDDKIHFFTSQNRLFAASEEVTVTVQLMQGQYPRYEQVIPKEFAGKMELHRRELVQVLERAELVEERARLQINTENNNLTISSKSNDSQYQDEVEIVKHSGANNFDEVFNIRYLLDFLKSVDGETVELNFIASLKPVLMRVSETDDLYQYIAMPINVAKEQKQ